MPSSDPGQSRQAAPAQRGVSQRRLLQSVVEVARSTFGAAAASVFLVDEVNDELVFEAVSGEGEGDLVGRRFPAGTGIAGWVLSCGHPLLVDEVSDSPLFAQDAASSTGYVPRSIMAAPLIGSGECLGVLEVLDRGSRNRGELADMDLLGFLATELGTALELLSPAQAGSETGMNGDDAVLLRRVAGRLPAAAEPVARTVRSLLAMVDDLLSQSDVSAGRASA